MQYPIELFVKAPYSWYLMNGEKTVEWRLGKDIYFRTPAGSEILINNTCYILEKALRYNSFRAMLEGEGIEKVLPDIKSIDDGVKLYRRFFSEEKERKFWVAALRIQRIIAK